MSKRIEQIMHKINIIVLLGLCSGYAHKLFTAQANVPFAVEKAMIHNNPAHTGQGSKAVTSAAKKSKKDVLEIYGHKIPKGAMEQSDYNKLCKEFKKREASEAKRLAKMEEAYRTNLQHFYEGELLEKMLGSFIKVIRRGLEQYCMDAICTKVRALEENQTSKCAKESKNKEKNEKSIW